MGKAEQLSHDDAGLTVAEIVGLQACEDEVGVLGFDGRGEQASDAERIALAKVFGVDMDGAVGALGEGFADDGANALRSGADDNDFSAMLLLELERFFEGVCVGLVECPLEIGFFDPLGG